MSDDLIAKINSGVERMVAASSTFAQTTTAKIERLQTELAELRGTVKALPPGAAGPAGLPGERGPEGTPGRDGRDALAVPGPQGEKGIDGRDGKDGRDGITLDQLKAAVAEVRAEVTAEIVKSIDFDGRRFTIAGQVVKYVPTAIYRGVFREGTEYEHGDRATYGGSEWHANKTTTERPGTNGDWTLAVKRGRDGKDGGK